MFVFALFHYPLLIYVMCVSFDKLINADSIVMGLNEIFVLLLLQLMQNHVLALAPDFLARKTAHDVFSRHTMVSDD